MKEVKNRDINLDLIRAVALISVPVMHAYDNSGFYTVPCVGVTGYVMATIRIAMTYCVPVFLMLTGYLCCQKTWSRSYYVGILRILLTYLVSSLLCIAFEAVFIDQEYSLRRIVSDIVNFEVGYGWYIMLYVGLFLLMPFLNLMFNGSSTKGQLALIASFFALSILGSFLNSYVHIWSVWWTNLYPLCYYFTGAYLSRNKPKRPAWQIAVLLLGLILLLGAYDVLHYKGDASSFHRELDYSNYQIFIISLLLFRFLQALDLSRMGNTLRRAIAKISQLSLAAYLCSWIPDGIIYRVLVPMFPNPEDRYIWLPLTVLLSLAASLVLAQIVCWVCGPVESWLKPKLTALLQGSGERSKT